MSLNYCCHDDYTLTGQINSIDTNILVAYQMYLQANSNTPPPDIPTFLEFYNVQVNAKAVASLGNKTIESLPVMDCANFTETGAINANDTNILIAYQMYLQANSNTPPPDIPTFLTFYNTQVNAKAVASLGNKTIEHLPTLESDENIITSDGLVPKCVEAEDKLWVAFTGNNYYSEWFELETDEAEDFTKFKIVTPNYGTTLQTWASDKTTTLQGILMTASSSKPSATKLTDDQQTKTFNSDLLKFNCDGTYNADHGVNSNQVNLRVKAFNNQNVSSIKKYGSEGSTHGYLAIGKPWEGSNMVYRTTTFNSIVRDDSGKNSIDIEYMYFIKETDEDAKIKFSDSTPSNSTCDLFA